MKYQELITKVSKDLGYSQDIIKKVYQSYWLFIKSTIRELPLDKDLTEEDFINLRTNFNIPSIGKMVCRYSDYKTVRNRYNKYVKNKEN